MKFTLGLAASVAALVISGGVSAADVYGKGSTKDADGTFSPRTVNWTGFYIGGSLGYGNANHKLSVQQYNGAYCFDQYGNQLTWTDLADTPEGAGPDGILKDNPLTIFTNEAADNTPAVNRTDGVQDADEPTTGNTTKAPKDPTAPWKDGLPFGANSEGTCANESVADAPDLGGIFADDSIAVDASKKGIASIDGVNSSGLVGDGRLGYDFARGRFLFGVFGSYGFNNMETEVNNTISIANADRALDLTGIQKGNEWSVGARAGLIVAPRTLAYILAAYTQTDYEFSGNVTDVDGTRGFSRETTFDGVTVGGGVEFALTQNVFLGIEGTHTFYGKETVLDTGGTDVGGFGQRITDDLDETKVMGTLKIKLNSGLDLTD